MSLVTDPSIRKYYEDASQDIQNRSSAFWFGVLRRHFGCPFEVNPAYSPDGSRRSVDAAVERFEETQETHVAMLWVECKHPDGNPEDVEVQALDAAVRCIDSRNLTHIWAVATIGVRFRVWRAGKKSKHLEPWHGTDTQYDASQYVDADSPNAVVFSEAVHQIHTEPALVDAATLPNQPPKPLNNVHDEAGPSQSAAGGRSTPSNLP